ncbi:MAG: hypothetical protein A4E42_00282 [Methanoregulaceae archaeon PtaU1.Bin222]|nr:MAG: hypothetical protein A4E42_00282 [Methanoregulaceae archaeon PtaU1.Bin222]
MQFCLLIFWWMLVALWMLSKNKGLSFSRMATVARAFASSACNTALLEISPISSMRRSDVRSRFWLRVVIAQTISSGMISIMISERYFRKLMRSRRRSP